MTQQQQQQGAIVSTSYMNRWSSYLEGIERCGVEFGKGLPRDVEKWVREYPPEELLDKVWFRVEKGNEVLRGELGVIIEFEVVRRLLRIAGPVTVDVKGKNIVRRNVMILCDEWLQEYYYQPTQERDQEIRSENEAKEKLAQLTDRYWHTPCFFRPRESFQWYFGFGIGALILISLVVVLVVPRIIWPRCSTFSDCWACTFQNKTQCYPPVDSYYQTYLIVLTVFYAPTGALGLILGSLFPTISSTLYFMASLGLLVNSMQLFPLDYPYYLSIQLLLGASTGFLTASLLWGLLRCCGIEKYNWNITILSLADGVLFGRIAASFCLLSPSPYLLLVNVFTFASGPIAVCGCACVILPTSQQYKLKKGLLAGLCAAGGWFLLMVPLDAAYVRIFSWSAGGGWSNDVAWGGLVGILLLMTAGTIFCTFVQYFFVHPRNVRDYNKLFIPKSRRDGYTVLN